MGLFVARPRKMPAGDPEAGRDLSERERAGLPPRFEAVGEALASGSGSTEACDVAGRSLAQDGASLGEALASLRTTAYAVTRADPAFDDVQALSVAWSEATLAYLHQLSCEDPLTGLASLAHVRSRLTELYREHSAAAAGLRESHALVVIDLPLDRPGVVNGENDSFSRVMRLVRLGEAARSVFADGETIGRLGSNRIVVVVARDETLGRRVAILRRMLGVADHPTRAWIEGLPESDDAAAMLLDELARP